MSNKARPAWWTSSVGWLDNLGTVTKINAAVGLLALTSTGVAIAGVAGAQSISHTSDETAQHHVASVTEAQSLKLQFLQVRMTGTEALVTPDAAAKQASLQKAGQLRSALLSAAPAFRDRPDLTDAERQAASAVVDDLTAFSQTSDQVLALMSSGKMQEGAALSTQKLTPLSDKVTTGLDKVVALKIQDVQDGNRQSADTTTTVIRSIIIIGVIGLLLAFAVARLVGASIVSGLRRIEDTAAAAARGDLRRRTGLTRRDETGRTAAALDTSLDQLGELIRAVTTTSTRVVSSVESLRNSAASVAEGSQHTSDQASTISSTAEEVSRSVQTVAAGTEEMTSSIRSISASAHDAAGVAAQAVTTAENTNQTVANLGRSSQEIGEVVKTITSIAEQTNLLALNATIEAARAGEAGKGFAVVANEVKDLAQETATATEDIGRRVQAIQVDTDAALAAIADISHVIAAINDTQSTIASAVEEQTATTNEMGRSVSGAATGSSQIATSIDAIASTIHTSNETVARMTASIADLGAMTQELRQRIDAFAV